MTKKQIPKQKAILLNLTSLLIASILFFAFAELTSRYILGVHPKGSKKRPAPYNTAIKDKELGWKMTPDYTFDGKMQDAAGNAYPIRLRYDSQGFKSYGDIHSDKPKVFFIGDSYTASIEVSNEDSFFELIKDSLDVEVFAYGQAGYGTLQQLMILEKYVPIIQPDLIVWQTCSNDFVDNYAPLELLSGYKVGERRPYLQDDLSIRYEQPLSGLEYLALKSGFFNLLHNSWKNFSFNHLKENKKIAEYWISNQKEFGTYQPYEEAKKATELIVHQIEDQLPLVVDILVFSAGTFEPQMTDLKEIFATAGYYKFNTKAAKLVQKAKYHKQIVNSKDQYHWNPYGHELIAKGLLEDIRKLVFDD